ncbi:universal stress protein [Tateyamaria pelophila]|uniref:universal stress protein n=1 Tax=Tateyamaria pelophila TaxID=328415 RepID=UPI001CC1C166|nr:universal stress protein [Tateyamaria pelophila]
MYNKILVATDGSELAQSAVEHGAALARAVGASVLFVTVTETWSAFQIASGIETGQVDAVREFEEAAKTSAQNILNAAKEVAVKLGVQVETHHILDRPAAEGIIQAAELEDCDLIVMASHGRRGLGRVMLGSETAEVLATSKTPVLVLR